ncbi:MAG: alginate lyase family protein [Chloroflexi bacterium]|nr:alginate lyase family protein [Chloroflexota bacterium]
MSSAASQARGLFHSAADLQLARANREREPIRGALDRIRTLDADPLARAHLAAIRGQFCDEAEASQLAAEELVASDFADDAGGELDDIKRALGWLAVLAMLRDEPAWQSGWRSGIQRRLARLALPGESSDTERELWRGALTMAAGILLGREEELEDGAAVYRRVVAERIHPEGFIRSVADIADAPGRYEAQLSATCALALLAEMAALSGRDLWSYESRAVSATTAITYTHYYYFFPEKWRWEVGLTRERTLAAMRREGAFMEMVQRRNPPPGIEQLLAEQRPLFCAWGGGLTTLTHGLTPRKKKRWRFW